MKWLSNRKAFAPVLRRVKSDATALRLGLKPFPTQGSRGGNPGLEGVTALRFGVCSTAEIASDLGGVAKSNAIHADAPG